MSLLFSSRISNMDHQITVEGVVVSGHWSWRPLLPPRYLQHITWVTDYLHCQPDGAQPHKDGETRAASDHLNGRKSLLPGRRIGRVDVRFPWFLIPALDLLGFQRRHIHPRFSMPAKLGGHHSECDQDWARRAQSVYRLAKGWTVRGPIPVDARSEGEGLWPLACWHCGFESRQGMDVCVLYSKWQKAQPGQSGQRSSTDEVQRTKKSVGAKFFSPV
jgi:hypothetical protein